MASAPPADRAAQVVAAQGKASAAEHRRELPKAIALYDAALTLATELYREPDSLVIACSQLVLITQRFNLAQMAALPQAERATQLRLMMANLEAGHEVIEARRAAGTLSTPRPEETEFETARRQGLLRLQPFAPPPGLFAMVMAPWVPLFGYICALWGAIGCTAALFSFELIDSGALVIDAAQRLRFQNALIAALDMIAVVRGGGAQGPPGLCNQESSLAECVQGALSQARVLATPFGARLAAAWQRPQVVGALQALGLRVVSAHMAGRYAREGAKADARVVARGGLRKCGLEGCGAQELHAAHFKVCSRCHAAAYCCVEHGTQAWPAHKKLCKVLAAARQAD